MAEIGKKQIEQTIQQLQEQLQLNLIQQTHILQSPDKKKASGSLQQLALQQQQLIQQLQLMHRQYVVQGIGMQPLMLPQGAGRDECMKRMMALRWERNMGKTITSIMLLCHSEINTNSIKLIVERLI